MIVFTQPTCPKCKVVKMKLDKAGKEYTINEDVDYMMSLGLKGTPAIQLDSGELIPTEKVFSWLKENGI